MFKDTAFFTFSTEEDFSYVLEFSGLVLTGRSFEVKIKDRASDTTRATLTNGAGLTVTGTNILEAAYAKADMSGWPRGEYSADVVDVTSGAHSRIQAVRFVLDLPGRLVQGVRDRKAFINWSPNQAVVTSTGAIGPAGPRGPKGDAGDPGADGTDGTNGTNGWTAELALVADGAREVQQVSDWFGGSGTKPTTGQYVGDSGFVSDIALGKDIRGPVGPGIGPSDFASQAEAEAASIADKAMSPLRTKQSIAVNAEGGSFTPAGSNIAARTLRDKARETAVSLNDYTSVANAIAAASGSRVLFSPTGSHSVGASNLDIGLGVIESDAGASFSGTGYILPSGLTYTNSERFGKRISNSSISAYDIYGSIYPNVSYFDVMQSVAYLPPGSDIGSHISAVSGYARSDTAATTGGNNIVALFGSGMAAVNNSAVWGVNTLLQDGGTRTAHTGTGRVLTGAELDFNVMSPNTQLIGVSVGGNSLAQPTNASAFIVNTLSQEFDYKWTTGFSSFDSCATNAFYMGTSADSGSNVPSQIFLAAYRDGSGVKQNLIMRAESGLWNFVTGGIKIAAGNLLLESGQSLVVNGNAVVGARKTGWTASTGTLFRSSFDANYTQTISGSYSQAQVQAIQDDLVTTKQRLAALEADIRSHGLIN